MTRSKSSRATRAPLRYRVELANPGAHVFEVQVTVLHPAVSGQRFALPVWIPGSYLVREFARNIVEIRAFGGRDAKRTLEITKLDKNTWEVAPHKGPITLIYSVYALDASVRAAHFDTTHAFFNGTSLFLRVLGQEAQAHELEIVRPSDKKMAEWRIATTLPELAAKRYGFGTYQASNYDELVDHPIEIGNFELLTFQAAGVSHDIAITGSVPNLDGERLCTDLQRLCAEQILLFDPRTRRAPFSRYLFLASVVTDGHGGLEHRCSTALLCNRRSFPVQGTIALGDDYESLLGLVSHEYFHSWLVKRIKPAAFAPYDFDCENYTSLLWIFEGFTSYYDSLLLRRSGLLSVERYLKDLAKTISDVLRNTGRTKQSVAQSSFDAWIKYYRPDENSINSVVSYYKKGALIALALDLTIREETDSKYSLDDVMRALWQQFGRNFYPDNARGLAEDGFADVVRAATGVDVSRQVRQWAYGTGGPPLRELLDRVGVKLTLAPAGTPRRDGKSRPYLGMNTASHHGLCRVTSVHDDSPAQHAGLSAGDVLVALGGLRLPEDGPESLLERYQPGQVVDLHFFRRDELMSRRITLAATPPTYCTLTPTQPARKSRRAWIG